MIMHCSPGTRKADATRDRALGKQAHKRQHEFDDTEQDEGRFVKQHWHGVAQHGTRREGLPLQKMVNVGQVAGAVVDLRDSQGHSKHDRNRGSWKRSEFAAGVWPLLGRKIPRNAISHVSLSHGNQNREPNALTKESQQSQQIVNSAHVAATDLALRQLPRPLRRLLQRPKSPRRSARSGTAITARETARPRAAGSRRPFAQRQTAARQAAACR